MIDDELLKYLKDKLYIVSISGKDIITNKLKRQLASIGGTSVVTKSPIIKALSITEAYKKFIEDAQVPTKINASNGAYFFANRYSKKGEDAFKKVWLDDKVDKRVLLAATRWYYKQTTASRVMISTFFIDGIWQSCYDDIKKAIDKMGVPTDNAESAVSISERDNNSNSLRL